MSTSGTVYYNLVEYTDYKQSLMHVPTYTWYSIFG